MTDYLSSVSPEWGATIGKGGSVTWPVGIGAKGNGGVAVEIKKRRYAVGYLELATAIENNLKFAHIRNSKGNFVEPDPAYMTAAANRAARNMPADFRVSLVNEAATYAYPIVGFTWLLVYQEQSDPVKGKELVEFLSWAMNEGQEKAAELNYGPLPERMRGMVKQRIKLIRY